MRDDGTADMLVPPPTEPIGAGPAPMPVSMAPGERPMPRIEADPSLANPTGAMGAWPIPPRRAGHTVGAKRRLLAALARRRAKRTRRI